MDEVVAPAATMPRPNLTKLTVNLTDKSLGAMLSACARHDETKTNTVNRALQVYDMLTRVIKEDQSRVVILDNAGRARKIEFL